MKTLTEIIKGMPKEVIVYLEKNTELATVAINSYKSDFKMNIIYIFLGGLIGFISSYSLLTFQTKSEERIIQLSKLLLEKNELQSDFEKRLNDMNTLTLELKIEIDSLKIKK